MCVCVYHSVTMELFMSINTLSTSCEHSGDLHEKDKPRYLGKLQCLRGSPGQSLSLKEARARILAGSETGTVENTICYLALRGLLRLISCTTQNYLSWGSTAHSGLGPPMSINNKDNSHTCPQTKLIWPILQLFTQDITQDIMSAM